MNWIFLTLLAASLETVSNILDRYILKNDLKHTDTLLILWGYFAAIMFVAPAFLVGTFSFDAGAITVGLISGLFYLVAMHYYYKAMNSGEVSRVVPILSVNPVIVLILATIFLGETHEPIKYLGIGLIMLGVLIHAIDREHQRLINKKALLWAILAAVCFALKNVLVKWLTLTAVDPLNVLCWVGLGIFLFNLPITWKLGRKLDFRKNKKLADIALAAALAGSVTLIYTAAIISGPAALVAFLHRIQILFVFIISEAMDFFNPKILHEKFIKPAFYQKLLGVIVVLIGSYFLI
jgi:transporter family protein